MTNNTAIRSSAKVNLFLDIICKRPDGYHNIETIFQAVSLSDVVQVELTRADIEIFCDDPSIPTDENNLAYKAFSGLSSLIGYKGGIRIGIEKNVPPGSGLGGGSSNAAATLVALNRLLDAGLSDEQLRGIASEIGADVPFFVSGGLAAGWARGDKTERLTDLAESSIVIVVPNDISVSTAAAYRMLSAPECKKPQPVDFSECSKKLRDAAKALDPATSLWENDNFSPFLYNSLEEPIFSQYPEILSLKDLLLTAGAKGALMSGSGSAVFGLAESPEHARHIGSAVEKSGICRCFPAQTLSGGWEWCA